MKNKESKEEENKENLEQLVNDGDIVPYQLIYEVSFKPVFKIKTKLGIIADQLKKYYNATLIQTDKRISNEEVIIFSRENIQTLFSFVYFRVLEIPLEGKDFNLKQIKGEIDNFYHKALPYLKDVEINRIGVRFQYLGNIDKIERLKKLNELAVFKNLLKTLDCDNNKIALLKLHVFPEPKTEETIINLMSCNIEEVNCKFENAALIECIKGYFSPSCIDAEFLTRSHEYMQKNILEFLSEKGD